MTPALSTYDKLMMESQFEYLSAMDEKKGLWHASKQKGRDIFKAQLKALKLQRKKFVDVEKFHQATGCI